MSGWRPERDLDRVLDALTAELLASRDSEIALSVRQDGGDPGKAALEVRRLVSLADSGPTPSAMSRFLTHGTRTGARHQ